jgi:RsiW-degrading membrane proteinase PrsW (M82 family)
MLNHFSAIIKLEVKMKEKLKASNEKVVSWFKKQNKHSTYIILEVVGFLLAILGSLLIVFAYYSPLNSFYSALIVVGILILVFASAVHIALTLKNKKLKQNINEDKK